MRRERDNKEPQASHKKQKIKSNAQGIIQHISDSGLVGIYQTQVPPLKDQVQNVLNSSEKLIQTVRHTRQEMNIKKIDISKMQEELEACKESYQQNAAILKKETSTKTPMPPPYLGDLSKIDDRIANMEEEIQKLSKEKNCKMALALNTSSPILGTEKAALALSEMFVTKHASLVSLQKTKINYFQYLQDMLAYEHNLRRRASLVNDGEVLKKRVDAWSTKIQDAQKELEALSMKHTKDLEECFLLSARVNLYVKHVLQEWNQEMPKPACTLSDKQEEQEEEDQRYIILD
ncbi:hypothetical protein MBANPS3_003991 [Mucor bainieri]